MFAPQFNETWMFNNCTKATCEGNNRIVVVPIPQAEKIVCASGLEPKKIVDKDGCIERYECECKQNRLQYNIHIYKGVRNARFNSTSFMQLFVAFQL